MNARVAVLLLLLASCTTLPDVREVAVHGVVLAPDRASARETARIWDDVAPRLEALDAGLVVRPVEVWLLDGVDDANVYGGYDVDRSRVLLDVERRHPEITLAHELVHAYEPESWARLPAVVREGLADWLASCAVPGSAAEMRASRAVSLASYALGGLPVPVEEEGRVRIARMGVEVNTDLTPLDALRIPHGRIRSVGDGRTLKALYGMGLLIATRAGLDRLTTLSREAEEEGRELVPAQRILEAARLDPDPATWLPAIEGMIAQPEQQAAVRRVLGLGDLPPGDPAPNPGGVRD